MMKEFTSQRQLRADNTLAESQATDDGSWSIISTNWLHSQTAADFALKSSDPQ